VAAARYEIKSEEWRERELMMSQSGSDVDEGATVSAVGVTDLMTSLAVMFILLLAASLNKVDEPSPSKSAVNAELPQRMESLRLPVDAAPADPDVLRVVVPDSVLHFEFGRSALLPEADAFLTEAMPQYAVMLCGPNGQAVESFSIEGHTDDLGEDIHNLKLSQDRAFAVLAKGLDVIRHRLPWAYECFQRKVSANGRGRQDLLLNAAGFPDRDKSRRVVFKFHLRHT
jgi:outer membrane protein OmpA-like peptidoglycan-associated protein